jgi:hypothetical protein
VANLTVTAGVVVADAGFGSGAGTSGANVAAGNLVYLDSTDSYLVKLADCANTTKAGCVGVALNGASVGQPVQYQTSGSFTFTTTAANTVAVGTVLAVAVTAGAIRPATDNTTGNYVTVIGVSTATNKIKLGLVASGVAV